MTREITPLEVKKLVYKQQPNASLYDLHLGTACYTASIEIDQITTAIRFDIPVTDMGDGRFYPEMEAKFLLRWLKPLVVGLNNMTVDEEE